MDGELRDPRGAPKGHVKPIAATLSIAIFLAVIATPPGAAQEQLPVKAAVFTIRDLGTGADADFDELLSDSVRLEIANAGYSVVDEWNKLLEPGEASPVRGPRAAELARGVGAAVAVTGFYTRPDAGSVALSVQCWETDGETLLASFTLAAPFDLSFYNLLHDHLADFLAAAEKFTGPPRIEAIEIAEARGLGTIAFLSSQDGVEVLLAGEKSLGTVTGGRLEAAVGLLTTGSRLELTLRKDGFHALDTAVTAIPEIRLPELLPARRFSLDLGWNNGQPLGVSAAINWFPVADWVFVGGATQVCRRSFPRADATGEYAVLHFDVGARAGVYLLPLKPSHHRLRRDAGAPVPGRRRDGLRRACRASCPFARASLLDGLVPLMRRSRSSRSASERRSSPSASTSAIPSACPDRRSTGAGCMRRVPNQSDDDSARGDARGPGGDVQMVKTIRALLVAAAVLGASAGATSASASSPTGS